MGKEFAVYGEERFDNQTISLEDPSHVDGKGGSAAILIRYFMERGI